MFYSNTSVYFLVQIQLLQQKFTQTQKLNLLLIEREIVNGICGDDARPDVGDGGVWTDGQNAFFVVRITNTYSASQHNVKTEKVLLRLEKEKKRKYNRRIMNIEHGTFTSLAFSVSGVFSKFFSKHMAEKIAKQIDKK